MARQQPLDAFRREGSCPIRVEPWLTCQRTGKSIEKNCTEIAIDNICLILHSKTFKDNYWVDYWEANVSELPLLNIVDKLFTNVHNRASCAAHNAVTTIVSFLVNGHNVWDVCERAQQSIHLGWQVISSMFASLHIVSVPQGLLLDTSWAQFCQIPANVWIDW
jgi:hypothetical protein